MLAEQPGPMSCLLRTVGWTHMWLCSVPGMGAPAGLTLLAGPLLHRQQSEQPHKQVLRQHRLF